MSTAALQQSTSSRTLSNNTPYTTLADQLRDSHENERPPDCKRPDCPGSLSLIEHPDWAVDLVICQLCRTTPDGKYIPPVKRTGGGVSTREGWGKCPEERYAHSGRMKMAGGFDDCYDEDDDRRPSHLDDEYTFDVSTY